VGGVTLRDHEHRHLANLGTFHAHRWLRAGADRKDTADLRRARALLERAIALNPDAHFGREKYQLKAVKWLLNPPKGVSGGALTSSTSRPAALQVRTAANCAASGYRTR